MLNKKLFPILFMLLLFQLSTLNVQAANVSQGVYHSKDSVPLNGANQSINQLSINLNQPYTTIDVGIPSPLDKLATVSSLAKLHTQNQHHVVGAINASFFHFSNGFPSYLLMKDSKIHHLGAVSTNTNDYMYVPAAFGVTGDNTAKIGKYGLEILIEHGNQKFKTTSLNRERGINESIFYTSSYSYTHTRTNNTGWEIVVETPNTVEQQIALGQKISGKVIGVRPRGGQTTSAAIPKNGRGFVLSATGNEIDNIKNMKIGDSVSVSYNIDDAWKNSKFMLATGPLLVQEGKANMTIDSNSPNARQRTARTAVATDATGKRAFFVTVDSSRNGKTGMTLSEFANYLAKQEGVYNAINLDGGGSTAMVARKQGNVYPTLVNRPADGSERRVSAILEAISTAPYSKPKVVQVKQSEAGTIEVGASVGFTVESALDEYYNVLTVDQSKLKLTSVTNGVGKIEGNKFVGVKAGTGNVNAVYDGTSVSIPVTVKGKVDDLNLTPTYLGSFESTAGLQAETARAKASLSLESSIQAVDQKHSVRLSYDFSGYKEGVSAAYLKWKNGLKLPSEPKKIGVWVYGDGNNHWLRGALTDANNQNIVVDFTENGGLNWVGWKYVEADIPQTAVAPYTLNQIYIAETNATKKDKGFILFDKIQVHYSNKANTEPAFTPTAGARQVPVNKKFTITFTQPMNTSYFTEKYIYVEDVNGVRQPVKVSKTSDPRKVEISAPVNGYTKGQSYRLVATHFAQNDAGIPMVRDHVVEFKVE